MRIQNSIWWIIGTFCAFGVVRNLYLYFFIDEFIYDSFISWIPMLLLGCINVYLYFEPTIKKSAVKTFHDFNVPRIKRDKTKKVK